jgi:ankyrin repeat protein
MGIVDCLLAAGANVDVTSVDGETPLMVACRAVSEIDDGVIESLFQKGAKTNVFNHNGQGLLHVAVNADNDQIIKSLAKFGVHTDHRDHDGCTALHLACMMQNILAVERLLAVKADPNIADDTGRNCLHTCSLKGDESLVKVIATRITDISARDYNGETAYDLARKGGMSDLANMIQKTKKHASPKDRKRPKSEVCSCQAEAEFGAYWVLRDWSARR